MSDISHPENQGIDPHYLALVASVSRNMGLVLDETGAIQWANASFEELTGYRLPYIRGSRPKTLLTGPATDPATLSYASEKLNSAETFETDILLYSCDKTPFWVHLVCVPVGPQEGVAPGFIVIMNNISDRKENERNLRIAASVFDYSHEAIIISDRNNRILDVNPAFSSITGYNRSEVLGLNPSILSSGRHSPAYYQSMWQSIKQTGQWRGEIWNRRKNGEEFVELLSINRVHMDDQDTFYHVAAFTDITAIKNHARELDKAYNYDELTGLPNRQLMEERLREARIHADRLQRELSVCYLDLDGFKAVNDTFGEATGNQILNTIAGRLTQALRSGDTVARVGGDEFGVILQSDNHDSVYERILSIVNEPVDLGGGHKAIRQTASLGITRYPADNADAEGLIRHADQAMYSAKEKGRNLLHFFDPALNEHRQQRRKRLTDMARALENNEFELYFQPQIRLADCKVVGFEALLRWRHPHQGLLKPGAFLPTLEGSHLEAPLGQWVLKEAIHQMNLWSEAGENLSVSVNISGRHLMDPAFTRYLESYLHSHPAIKPERITLEVLESAALDDLNQARNALAQCQALGLRIALDDFGTGFSSLTYLRTLPVDVVKIDKSFVSSMLTDTSDRAIVESVVFLGQRFSHPVVAEGVETPEQAQALRQLGCEFIQGYGIARPMPANKVQNWLQHWRAIKAENTGYAIPETLRAAYKNL